MHTPDIPLYKYLSLAVGQSPTWQERLEQLLKGRCYLPSPIDFNDPFDCLPYIHSPHELDELSRWKVDMTSAMTSAIQPENPLIPVESQIRQALGHLSSAEISDKLQIAAKKSAERIGVFCLSERIDSVLMWSHYASHHRGIAIQFSFKDKLQNALFPLSKVKYRNHRPVVDEFSKSDPNLHLSDALAIKANFWKYEREWRALKPDKSGSTIKFESKVITGIVFGVNCTVVDEHEIRNLAQNHSLAIYRMRPDLTTFDLSMIPLD